MRTNRINTHLVMLAATALAMGVAGTAAAQTSSSQVVAQCPDWRTETSPVGPGDGNGYKCMHISAGDGFAKMADGKRLYSFGFSDLTAATFKPRGVIDAAGAVSGGLLMANAPAPTISLDEGERFYLTLTNVGMLIRPDLFDPHTVHYHGFPNASAIFDGVPDASLAINQTASLTYFYNLVEPGTYMYHCHVEATEHMQMGMLGNLYVRPKQNHLPNGTDLDGLAGGPVHVAGNTYVYNDQDGSTRYDVEYPIQMASYDGRFHDASESVQPLPFAAMKDNYPLLNGRGYPDTVLPSGDALRNGDDNFPAPPGGNFTQRVSSLITATAGQKILLRISNLNVTRFHTLGLMGLKMKVVGRGARLLRGRGETDLANPDLYYETSSVTLGGGEAVDAIIDTAGVTPGTYVLYTTNLNLLSNDAEDLGGMMTEIVISPAV